MEVLSFNSSSARFSLYVNFARGHSIPKLAPFFKLLKLPDVKMLARCEFLYSNFLNNQPVAIIFDIKVLEKNNFWIGLRSFSLKTLAGGVLTPLTLFKFFCLCKFHNPTISLVNLYRQVSSFTTKTFDLKLFHA